MAERKEQTLGIAQFGGVLRPSSFQSWRASTMANCCIIPSPPVAAPRTMSCPVSGTRSKQVDSITVKSLVRQLPFKMPARQYYLLRVAHLRGSLLPSRPQSPDLPSR